MYVQLIERLSSQSLRESTLWFMDSAIGRSVNELVPGFRWCPECLREMEQLGQEPYFKLIWHMSGIEVCPTHRASLISACDFCRCKQTSYKKYYSIGYCQRCGQKLSLRKKTPSIVDVSPSWEPTGGDLLQLFTDLADSGHAPLPEDGIMRSLEQLFDYYWLQDREDELYRLITRDQYLALIHRQVPISLKVARRIAYRLGLSLHTLMSGNAHCSSAVLNSSWVCELPPSFMEHAAKTRRDHRKVMKKLRKIVSSAERPPSINGLATMLNVSVGYLEYRFPVMVREVVARHQAFVAEVRRKQHLAAQKAAICYFVSEEYSSYPKSRKQAYKVLRAETGLPKFMLKQVIQKAYDLLG